MKKIKKKATRNYSIDAANFSSATIDFLIFYLNITQAKAGRILGLSGPTISLIRRGRRNITIKNLIRCARKLKMSLSELVENIGAQKSMKKEYRAFTNARKASQPGKKLKKCS